MAAKGPAPTKAKATTKAKAKATGIQLTTAQAAAYNAAYTATATKLRNKLALQAAATNFRKYRLQAATSLVKSAAVARGAAQAAAVAYHATHQTYIQSKMSHQNSALQARIEQDMATHATKFGQLQYAAAGEKAYAHAAVMRTVDQSQALSHEAAVFKALSKTAKKASKSTPAKPGPNSKAIAAAASAAGAKAAKAVPATAKARTAPNFSPMPNNAADRYSQSVAMYNAMYVAHTRTKDAAKKNVFKTPWLGDDVTPNCIITAIANHLLHIKGLTATEQNLKELYEACQPEPTIEEVLWAAWEMGWPRAQGARLRTYRPVEGEAMDASCLVIGYSVETDKGVLGHAALSLSGGRVVSWGKVQERESPIEEAWVLEWES